MAHAFRNDVAFGHEFISRGISILKEPLKHRCLFRFADLACVHLSTELIHARTNELAEKDRSRDSVYSIMLHSPQP